MLLQHFSITEDFFYYFIYFKTCMPNKKAEKNICYHNVIKRLINDIVSIEDDPQGASVKSWPNLIDYLIKQINILLLAYTNNIVIINHTFYHADATHFFFHHR